MQDARSGETLYEKNADMPRAAASTQKLLTALIVAEDGFLDHTVTVELVDTQAEPVKLNIKAGEVYQRIELLRALLVKSPNDVARCLARDNAGSIELFADVMNAKRALLARLIRILSIRTACRFRAIFDGARSLADRAGRLRQSDDSLDCLSAAARFPLCQRPHPRAQKHEQGSQAVALLQRDEDRLHRGGGTLPHRQRKHSRSRRHRGRAGRQFGGNLAGRLGAALLGLETSLDPAAGPGMAACRLVTPNATAATSASRARERSDARNETVALAAIDYGPPAADVRRSGLGM